MRARPWSRAQASRTVALVAPHVRSESPEPDERRPVPLADPYRDAARGVSLSNRDEDRVLAGREIHASSVIRRKRELNASESLFVYRDVKRAPDAGDHDRDTRRIPGLRRKPMSVVSPVPKRITGVNGGERSGAGFPGDIQPLAGATILQIIPALDAGGAERTTVDVAAALAAVGARALVATEGGRLVGEMQAKGGTWLPFPAASKNPLAMAVNIGRLASLCRREGVQIVHARSRAPAWVALGAVRRLKIPYVTTYHGSYSGRDRSEGALQFGHGAGRRGHRQFPLHRRPHPDASSRAGR